MTIPRALSRVVLLLSLCHLALVPAAAQAVRTWVSAAGDDAHPGSRAAPCRTLAGVITKTSAGGEINFLDAAGVGGVTITKSITIDGGGTFASVLNFGSHGITIDGPDVVVTLRNLSIQGAGRGASGIRLLNGAVLTVENCVISGQAGRAIEVTPRQNARIFIKDTIIRGNHYGEKGGGIMIAPADSFSVTALLDNVRLEENLFGLMVQDRVTATVRNSTATGNAAEGFLAMGAGPVSLNLENCLAASNGTFGVRNGGQAESAVIRLGGVTVVDNPTGIEAEGDSRIVSFGNNRIAGNGVNGSPTATLPLR